MGNIRFYTSNTLDSATQVATSSRPLFGVSNIKVASPATHWRSSGLTGDNIKFTFTGNTPITYVSILGHNFHSTMVVYFESSADNFGSTAYSVQLTVQDNMFQSIAPQNQRYYRIRWATGIPANGTDTYVRIGRALGYSTYTEYTSTQASDFQTSINDAFSESVYGVSSSITRNTLRPITFQIVSTETFQDFLNTQRHTPFIIQKAAFTGGYDETSKNIMYSKIINTDKEHLVMDNWFYNVRVKDER